MKKVVVLVILQLFFCINVNAKTTAEFVKFVRCIDGDTAVLSVNNEEKRFRFLAIDTPETVHPTKEAEEYGKNASEYTCSKLSSANEIIVEYEESNKIDKYDRLLAWIWIDGSLLQKELVSIGYAEVAYIYGDYRYTKSLCINQKKAKELMLGIWNETQEEGYCSTIDISDEIDIIDYDKIANKEQQTKDEEQKLLDTEKKVQTIFEYINKFSKNLNNQSQKLKDNFVNYLFWGIVGASIIYLLYQNKNNK